MEQKIQNPVFEEADCDCGSYSSSEQQQSFSPPQQFNQPQNQPQFVNQPDYGYKGSMRQPPQSRPNISQTHPEKNEQYEESEEKKQYKYGQNHNPEGHHQYAPYGVNVQQPRYQPGPEPYPQQNFQPHPHPQPQNPNPYFHPQPHPQQNPHNPEMMFGQEFMQAQMMYGAPFQQAPPHNFQTQPYGQQPGFVPPNFMNPNAYPPFSNPYQANYYNPQQQSHSSMQSNSHSPHHHPKHMENRFGMAMETVNRIMAGQAQPDEIFTVFSVDFNHEQFWKGLIAGSLIAFLITNKSVKEGLANIFSTSTTN